MLLLTHTPSESQMEKVSADANTYEQLLKEKEVCIGTVYVCK